MRGRGRDEGPPELAADQSSREEPEGTGRQGLQGGLRRGRGPGGGASVSQYRLVPRALVPVARSAGGTAPSRRGERREDGHRGGTGEEGAKDNTLGPERAGIIT